MAKIRFAYDNRWRSAIGTPEASSAALALPAAATQNPDRSFVWRSLSLQANQTLTRDLGAAESVTMVALANVLLQNGGTVRLLEGGSGATPGAWNLVTTLPTQNADTRVTYGFFGPISARHWQLEWTNGIPGVPTIAEVGYVHLGGYYEPERNTLSPTGLERIDPSVGRASVDGQQSFAERTGYDTGELRFIASTAELVNFRTMYRTVGRRTPIFVVMNADVTWQAWLLRIASSLETPVHGALGQHNITFSWEESR